MSPLKQNTIIVLLGVFLALLIFGSKVQSSTIEGYYNYLTGAELHNQVRDMVSNFHFSTPNDENRLKISAAYCSILQAENKIKLSELDECATQGASKVEDLYKQLTKEDLGAAWGELSENEKLMAANKVIEAAKFYIQLNQFGKQLGTFPAQ